MGSLLFTLLLAFVTSILTIKILLPLAPHIGLIDIPTERKKHNGAIPLIGGISIFTGVLMASSVFLESSQLLNLYLISSALLVFIGTLDDIYDLSVQSRIIFQGLVASIMVFGANIYINDLGSVIGYHIYLGSFGIIFTILASLASINAFNMVDGIDGLAGSMNIITIGSISILCFLSGVDVYGILSLIVVVSIVPFLFYNVSRHNPRGKKIFMGDAGSMYMGLTVIWLLTLGSQGESAAFKPVTALWITAVPIMDMLTIMFRRIKHGYSPFKADNGHLHHLLLKLGYSPRKALLIISGVSFFIALIGIIADRLGIPDWIMFLGYCCLLVAYSCVLNNIFSRLNNEIALSSVAIE